MPTLAYEEGAPRGVALARYGGELVVYVNGTRRAVDDALPSMTLLEWLRSIGLTGTKLGCGEGGCGACTVMISSFDVLTGAVRHAAVNACLMPLCAAHWCAVTTVEGIGSWTLRTLAAAPRARHWRELRFKHNHIRVQQSRVC